MPPKKPSNVPLSKKDGRRMKKLYKQVVTRLRDMNVIIGRTLGWKASPLLSATVKVAGKSLQKRRTPRLPRRLAKWPMNLDQMDGGTIVLTLGQVQILGGVWDDATNT